MEMEGVLEAIVWALSLILTMGCPKACIGFCGLIGMILAIASIVFYGDGNGSTVKTLCALGVFGAIIGIRSFSRK